MLWTLFDVATFAGLIALLFAGFIHGIILIALLEYDKRKAGAILTACTIVAVIMLGNTSFFGWLGHHWLQAIFYFVGYIASGATTGYLKWFSRARHGAERWYAELATWLRSLPAKIAELTCQINDEMRWRNENVPTSPNQRKYCNYTDLQIEAMRKKVVALDTAVKAKDITDEAMPYFDEHIAEFEKRTGKLCHLPHVDEPESLGLFISWFSFWPWVLVWTIINDPLRRLGTHIYFWMKGRLQKAADYAWRDIKAKLEKVKAAAEAKAKAEAAKAEPQSQSLTDALDVETQK